MESLVNVVLLLVLGWILRRLSKIGSREPLLPPGPPTVAFFGNLKILPKELTYLRFTEWAQQFGGVFSLKVGWRTTIVLTSIDAIYEIMERNGSKTADRPRRTVLFQVFGPDGSIAISPYNKNWRIKRRAVNEALKPAMCKKYIPAQMAESSQLIYNIYRKPESFFDEIERAMLSTVYAITWGIRTPQHSSPLVEQYNYYSRRLLEIASIGNIAPIDLFPWLKFVPERFLGNWKSRCSSIRKVQRNLFFGLLETVEKRRLDGMRTGCVLDHMIDKAEQWGLNRESLAYISGNLLTGAAHQVIAHSKLVVLLAIIYPETQQKALEELNRVVGSHRSPTMDDIPNLPYLDALLKEIYRFHPVLPLGQSHRATEDQMYRDYLIPKGANIYMNVWGIFRDPDMYDDPDTFDPDRFIRSPYGVKKSAENLHSVESLKKLESLPFGAGRRICPGADLSHRGTLLIAANLLWSFEFSPPKDESGRELNLDVWDLTIEGTNELSPFKCIIKPRSPSRERVIVQNYINLTPTFEMFEKELDEEDRKYAEGHRAEAIKLAQEI